LQIEDVYKEIDKKVQENSRKVMSEWTLAQLLAVAVFVSLSTWYGYTILFGTNSYSLVKELEMEKRELEREISELQKSNERLQKSYFNLKVTRGEVGNEEY
jgi:cell division protein FtsB